MTIIDKVLATNNDFPIRTALPVHNGKVRSVYWLTEEDSARLIQEQNYDIAADSPLAVMTISDRISAFECIWQSENLGGVPGKGAALNTISNHWFSLFKKYGLADSHILDSPHPLVWIVQKAKPIMIEAICRQYITGSMWRAYSKGERTFCGTALPDNLLKDSILSNLLITPSTKGIIEGLEDVPEIDDVNVSREILEKHLQTFNFKKISDIDLYEKLLTEGFAVISQELAKIGQLFVDTKFEFGYVKDKKGLDKLIYMDEVGTPDSSRIWDRNQYVQGNIIENSKEDFRKALLGYFPDPDILLNKNRLEERKILAKNSILPDSIMMQVSSTYLDLAEKITGSQIELSQHPRQEIINILDRYGLIK